ncbi:hypothetical protein GPUN_0077 [Glaciecola punicea ACAM 611]|uniref:Uncharacterized protein n=1 Tax=Glaciecola punicea ACAM 611 TaxID=1121923 RepID=H5T7F4_9ALTE|nr:hypothetical protein GPUN_0077 [Glaciecola punicea ACAM 611]
MSKSDLLIYAKYNKKMRTKLSIYTGFYAGIYLGRLLLITSPMLAY